MCLGNPAGLSNPKVCHNCFMPQMLIQQQKPLSRASPHDGNGEEKEQKSGEVMLVTSNHHSMADRSCEASRTMASFDSVSAEGAVIHSRGLQQSSAFCGVWILGFGSLFWFGLL